MTGQFTYSRNVKPIVGVAIAGFVLATEFCKLGGAAAQGCNLLDKTAWVALEVLRRSSWRRGNLCQRVFVRIQGFCGICYKLWHPSGRCFAS